MILDADFATIQFQQPASISLKTGQQAQVLKQKLVQIHVQKRFRLCSSDRNYTASGRTAFQCFSP
jgi:hypothetical protein